MKIEPVKIDTKPFSQFLAEALSRHFSEEAAKLAETKTTQKPA
jgi:hypothetical protein